MSITGDHIEDLWEQETPFGNSSQWYSKSTDYWANIEASVDGVLGGFGHLSAVDQRESRQFIAATSGGDAASSGSKASGNKSNVRGGKRSGGAPAAGAGKRKPVAGSRALDVGAGVGRTASGLLAPLFERVDLLEQDARFMEQARAKVPASSLGECFCESLQGFAMPRRRYDIVWIQWVLNYLTDEDLLAFLRSCARALRDPHNGLVYVKENMLVHQSDEDVSFNFDASDSSVTRTEAHFRQIFTNAGFDIVGYDKQRSFPKGMLPVRMFALRAKDPASVVAENDAAGDEPQKPARAADENQDEKEEN